jgi:predicted RecA/RadA family phage recombinase
MAIAQTLIYKRPNAAQSYDSFEKSYKGAAGQYTAINGAAYATNAGLPLRAGAGTYPEFTSADEFATVVQCSGSIKKFGDTYGIQIVDMVSAGECEFATSGKFSLRLDGSASVTVGADAYIITATMRVTHDASGNEYIGKFTSLAETNPAGRPAGNYATVQLNQTEL